MLNKNIIHKALLFLIILIALFVFSYGFFSRYILSEDLPNLFANVHALDEFHTPADSPFIYGGNPDFHATYTSAFISLLNKLNLFEINFIPNTFNFLNELSMNTLKICFIFSILSILLLILSLFIFSREYFKSEGKSILTLVLILLFVEIPLIRWAGIFSLHGLSFGAYYPQVFALSFLFLSLYSFQKLSKGDNKFISLSILFPFISFISHPFTGLISFTIGMFFFSLNYLESKKNVNVLMIFLLLFSFLLTNLWPFVSFFKIVNSIIPYYAVLLFLIFMPFFAYIYSITIKQDIFFIGTQKTNNFIRITILIWAAIILYASFFLKEYAYLDSLNLWLISFGFFIILGGVLIFSSKNNIQNHLFHIFLFWVIVSIILFILGLLGADIKVFWRFLSLIKIPATFIIVDFLYPFLKNKNNYLITGIFIFLILFSIANMFVVIQTSNTASYFKSISPEFFVSKEINFSNEIVISDPYTGYFIASLTKNKVIAIPENRISDYDYYLNREGINKLNSFYSSDNPCNEIEGLKINHIFLNKHLSILKGRTLKSNEYEPLIKSLQRCNFYTSLNNDRFIILERKSPEI